VWDRQWWVHREQSRATQQHLLSPGVRTNLAALTVTVQVRLLCHRYDIHI